MKKLIFVILSAALTFAPFIASAQDDPHVGVEGGLNISYINGLTATHLPEGFPKVNAFKSAPFVGAHLGFFGEFEFTEVFGIRPAVHVGQQGTLFALGDNSVEAYKGFSTWVCQTALNIPVHFTFDLFEDRLKLLIGPQFGFALACKTYSYWTKDGGKHLGKSIDKWSAEEYSVFDVGISAGVQFMFTDILGIIGKFNAGLIDCIKVSDVYNSNMVGQIGIVVRIS